MVYELIVEAGIARLKANKKKRRFVGAAHACDLLKKVDQNFYTGAAA